MSIVQTLFEHQLTLKMYHFQTTNYGAHKASDTYLITYTANLDRFMEVWQGQYGRVDDKQVRVNFNTVNDNTIIQHLDSMVTFLGSLNNGQMSIDLAAIRDEMVANIQQLKYLLTFK